MGTKIAIITDIHGNASALSAVLKDVKNEKNIEHIYCLGDIVAIGHETNEVLNMLFLLDNISFVIGNHEEDFLNIIHGRSTQISNEGVRKHHEWLVSRMDKNFIPKLMKMPRNLIIEYESKKILFTHYHLNSDQTYFQIDKNPTIDKLDEMYNGSDFAAVCFGHHHPLHFFQSDERLYINPGSLGCYDKPYARYCILNIDRQIEVQFKEVPYENREFLKAYETLSVPEKDLILKAFHGNQHLKFG